MNKKFILLLPLLIASLLLGSCNKKQNGQPTTSDSLTAVTADPTHQLKIGVVSLDSLYKNYEYYTQANKQIEAQLKRNQQTLANKMQQAQKAYASYMEKAQKGLFTSQAQVDAEEKRITAMQQEGAQLEQRYAEEAMKAQTDAQKALHDEVTAQLKAFNADKKYDLILTSVGLEGVMYAGEGFDITQEVLDFLNAAYQAKSKETKEAKK
ncbi:OmpH family outer membrane protein [uncultured Porphyromonas sp.]|uniref:OmpH family outer membrane protein n=1 Tax=uncultured Porphyromonas sp. TaxID=159274 RepID=UPI0026388D1E|nr:OmpH family outer membrane protein [uncultured Porphyromonas sp.]